VVTASVQTEAILVSSTVYGEADRIVTLVTRGLGKISAIARGARKSRTRFGAALAPFVVGLATVAERRGELFTLSEYSVVRDFSAVGRDVVSMAHASYAAELCRELSPPRQPEPALYALLVECLEALAQAPPRADTLRAFELRLLETVGLGPALDRCAACGEPPTAEVHTVDPGRGGIVCARCAAASRFLAVPVRLSETTPRRLLELAAGSLLEAATSSRDAGEEAAARQLTHGLIAPHLHAPLRSLEFLRQLRRRSDHA
jgi:DNA repair protein RecO (recombination protein O)